jgi:DNA polymerase III subunit chi
MTEISFYHLTTTPLERALPKILEKSLAAGLRSVVMVENEEQAELLGQVCWTYDPSAFLPHGGPNDPRPEKQPIYITSKPEAPNQPNMLVVTDGSELELSPELKKVIDLFDGQNPASVEKARARWKNYKAAGHTLTYFKQNESGGWAKQE